MKNQKQEVLTARAGRKPKKSETTDRRRHRGKFGENVRTGKDPEVKMQMKI
jgi:hypothetical protein